mmetsp:Transcript_84544/g.217802  ORF Transcript_84544/g.217802 Transcript_84544/m.217802 type:complete len:458 (-) Transcript_84544:271-1644(-)
MMAKPSGAAAAATYSFSSQPKPVAATRKKYRDPGEADTSLYRDLKETCITWDKRVHRGNTYGIYTQNAIKDALHDATLDASPKQRRKRKQKEEKVFDLPLPEKERIPVDLTKHLVAKEVIVEVETVIAQTDEFLPEPPSEQYQPQKVGVDVCTQVDDGELFNFDLEVEPILDVLVNKTLEQSIMEVEEEHEMESMKDFKTTWYSRQEAMAKDWQVQVQEEWVRWEQMEAIMARKREEKRREAQVLLKIQAMSAAKQHLKSIVPNSVTDLQEVAFPDMTGMAINRIFLPQLLGQVQQEVRTLMRAQQQVSETVSGVVRAQIAAHSQSIEAVRERHREADRKHFEELQIRQGKIRILVDDGHGGQVRVGPIQISSQDSVDEVLNRVYQWLQANEAKLAAEWPHGVVLCIDGEPIQSTGAIFEAKAGQISMVPKSEPPPAEDAVEGEEAGEDGEEGGEAG